MTRRRDRGLPSPTIVSCDNIVEKRQRARRAFTSFAELSIPPLAPMDAGRTPVPPFDGDRITLHHARRHQTARERLRCDRRVAGATEPFTAWALEDDFATAVRRLRRRRANGRRRRALRDDELRLLNASHRACATSLTLDGYRLVHEAAQAPLIAEFLCVATGFRSDTDAAAVLASISLTTAHACGAVANGLRPRHVARLVQKSYRSNPKWLLPVVTINLRSGGPVRLAAATVASWASLRRGRRRAR